MKKKLQPKSRLLAAIHESMADAHDAGLIDARKMKEFDALCLEPVPAYSSATIKKVRDKYHLSQAVLAAILNTSLSAIQQWERGDKNPNGAARKLLWLLQERGIEAVV
jgi:putative transcriptional regulator